MVTSTQTWINYNESFARAGKLSQISLYIQAAPVIAFWIICIKSSTFRISWYMLSLSNKFVSTDEERCDCNEREGVFIFKFYVHFHTSRALMNIKWDISVHVLLQCYFMLNNDQKVKRKPFIKPFNVNFMFREADIFMLILNWVNEILEGWNSLLV